MSDANVKMSKEDYRKAIVKHIDSSKKLGKLGPLIENCFKCSANETKDERLKRYLNNVIENIQKNKRFNPFVLSEIKDGSLFYPFEALFLESIFLEQKQYLVKELYSRWLGAAAKELNLFAPSFELLEKALKNLSDELGLKASLSASSRSNELSIDFYSMKISGIVKEDEYSGALIYELKDLVLNPSTLYLFQVLYSVGIRDILLEKEVQALELGIEGHPLEQLLEEMSSSAVFLKNSKQLGIAGIKVLENNTVILSPMLSFVDGTYYYNGIVLNSAVDGLWGSLIDEEV